MGTAAQGRILPFHGEASLRDGQSTAPTVHYGGELGHAGIAFADIL
jgi:hypothetical protein